MPSGTSVEFPKKRKLGAYIAEGFFFMPHLPLWYLQDWQDPATPHAESKEGWSPSSAVPRSFELILGLLCSLTLPRTRVVQTLLPFEARRSRCTRLYPFCHVSWVETLWTEKWKGMLRKPTAVHCAAGRQGRPWGKQCPERERYEVGRPLTLPATRWELPLSLRQKSKTLVEIERWQCKDALWASQ